MHLQTLLGLSLLYGSAVMTVRATVEQPLPECLHDMHCTLSDNTTGLLQQRILCPAGFSKRTQYISSNIRL